MSFFLGIPLAQNVYKNYSLFIWAALGNPSDYKKNEGSLPCICKSFKKILRYFVSTTNCPIVVIIFQWKRKYLKYLMNFEWALRQRYGPSNSYFIYWRRFNVIWTLWTPGGRTLKQRCVYSLVLLIQKVIFFWCRFNSWTLDGHWNNFLLDSYWVSLERWFHLIEWITLSAPFSLYLWVTSSIVHPSFNFPMFFSKSHDILSLIFLSFQWNGRVFKCLCSF